MPWYHTDQCVSHCAHYSALHTVQSLQYTHCTATDNGTLDLAQCTHCTKCTIQRTHSAAHSYKHKLECPVFFISHFEMNDIEYGHVRSHHYHRNVIMK